PVTARPSCGAPTATGTSSSSPPPPPTFTPTRSPSTVAWWRKASRSSTGEWVRRTRASSLARSCASPMTLDLDARGRLEAAFGREERRGLMQAAAARSAATAAIIGWLAVVNPERGSAYAWVLGTASFFLVTGLTQFWLYWRQLAPSWAPYAFMLVDSLALAAA